MTRRDPEGNLDMASDALVLSAAVREAADRSVLCWLATADDSGQPNVSPKEIFSVFDARHIVIANIASPSSAKNIEVNPRVCVSFVDVFVQKGFKVVGTARNLGEDDPAFPHWSAPLRARAGPRFPIRSVMLVEALATEPILAPSYRLHADETTEASQVEAAMRAYGVRPARIAQDSLVRAARDIDSEDFPKTP